MIVTEHMKLDSEGNFFALNITEQVREIVTRSGLREGSVLVFYRHTTGAVMAVEHEVGFVADLEDVFKQLAPIDGEWKHHRRGYDANGGAHIRAALLSPSLTVPVAEGELLLGTFQEIMVADFDPVPKPRSRTIVVQVAGA